MCIFFASAVVKLTGGRECKMPVGNYKVCYVLEKKRIKTKCYWQQVDKCGIFTTNQVIRFACCILVLLGVHVNGCLQAIVVFFLFVT